MIHHIWFAMVFVSVGYGCLQGKAGQLLEAALNGTEKAVVLTIQLCAGYMFFCGLLEIAKALRAERGVMRIMQPVLGRLLPQTKTEEACGAVALNLALNLLGMGNAATPAGLEAMRRMDEERKARPGIQHDMYMFLILNATSIQLLPTTVLTLRAAAGSADVNAIILPTILCTAFSTLAGTGLGMLCRKWEERKHGG